MKYLLIHGAWMTKECWSPTVELLEGNGHEVRAIDLPGRGADSTSPVTLDDYSDRVVSEAEAMGGDVNLVGHSMAGIVLSATAEKRPDLFCSLTYVAAYLVTSGQSLNDLAQTDADSGVGPNVRPAADWSTLDLAEESRAGLFFHDVPADVAAPFLAAWKAEPTAPQTTPLAVTESRFGSVARRYIKTLNDRVVSPSLQDRMLLATPTRTVTLETGHLPMLVDPASFVQTLEALA